MAELVVGQWVEISGSVCKVQCQDGPKLVMTNESGQTWRIHASNVDIKPFVWQVGRTYRTTLEDVTATITEGVDGRFLARLTGHSVLYVFNGKTGEPCDRVPWDAKCFLLPILADEPSEPARFEFFDGEKIQQLQPASPYDRVIGGVEVDLWTLADIYGITSHRLFSAWKKITMAGRRGPKDKLRDLKEARVALDKEIAKLEAEGGE